LRLEGGIRQAQHRGRAQDDAQCRGLRKEARQHGRREARHIAVQGGGRQRDHHPVRSQRTGNPRRNRGIMDKSVDILVFLLSGFFAVAGLLAMWWEYEDEDF
jgi:hypothetical protein